MSTRLRKLNVQIIAENVDEQGRVVGEGPLGVQTDAGVQPLVIEAFPWQLEGSPLAEIVAQKLAELNDAK